MIDDKIINPIENQNTVKSSVETLSNKEAIEKILNENETLVQDIKHTGNLANESMAIYPGAEAEDINAVKEVVKDIDNQLDSVQKDFKNQYEQLISNPTEYKSAPGESILKMVTTATELANTFNGVVNASLDDVEMVINPGDTPERIVKKIIEAKYTPELIAKRGHTLETLIDFFMEKESINKTEERENMIDKAKTVVDNFFSYTQENSLPINAQSLRAFMQTQDDILPDDVFGKVYDMIIERKMNDNEQQVNNIVDKYYDYLKVKNVEDDPFSFEYFAEENQDLFKNDNPDRIKTNVKSVIKQNFDSKNKAVS